jgi:putative DNA primase/helicase
VAQLLGDIRFHPALKHSASGTTHPAMLAFMGWDGKKFHGIHRTYLTPEGWKADVDPVRMAYGDSGAVRLGPAAGRMGIAEGIETALCAQALFGAPVWAGICANGLIAWEPPPEAQEILICGDNDGNFVGQAAAYDLAKKLRARGLTVEIKIPPEEGQDWAEVWARQQPTVAA